MERLLESDTIKLQIPSSGYTHVPRTFSQEAYGSWQNGGNVEREIRACDGSSQSIVEVRTEENCLAHALVISIAKVTNDPNYPAYMKGNKKILPKFRDCCRRQVSISVEEGSLNYRKFNVICHSIE
jgi:hypothetical protein